MSKQSATSSSSATARSTPPEPRSKGKSQLLLQFGGTHGTNIVPQHGSHTLAGEPSSRRVTRSSKSFASAAASTTSPPVAAQSYEKSFPSMPLAKKLKTAKTSTTTALESPCEHLRLNVGPQLPPEETLHGARHHTTIVTMMPELYIRLGTELCLRLENGRGTIKVLEGFQLYAEYFEQQHPLRDTTLSTDEQFEQMRLVAPNAVFNIALHEFQCPLEFYFGMVKGSCLTADLQNAIYECGYKYIEKVLGLPVTTYDLNSNTWQGPMQERIAKGEVSNEPISTLTSMTSDVCPFCPILSHTHVKTCGDLSEEDRRWSSAAQKSQDHLKNLAHRITIALLQLMGGGSANVISVWASGSHAAKAILPLDYQFEGISRIPTQPIPGVRKIVTAHPVAHTHRIGTTAIHYSREFRPNGPPIEPRQIPTAENKQEVNSFVVQSFEAVVLFLGIPLEPSPYETMYEFLMDPEIMKDAYVAGLGLAVEESFEEAKKNCLVVSKEKGTRPIQFQQTNGFTPVAAVRNAMATEVAHRIHDYMGNKFSEHKRDIASDCVDVADEEASAAMSVESFDLLSGILVDKEPITTAEFLECCQVDSMVGNIIKLATMGLRLSVDKMMPAVSTLKIREVETALSAILHLLNRGQLDKNAYYRPGVLLEKKFASEIKETSKEVGGVLLLLVVFWSSGDEVQDYIPVCNLVNNRVSFTKFRRYPPAAAFATRGVRVVLDNHVLLLDHQANRVWCFKETEQEQLQLHSQAKMLPTHFELQRKSNAESLTFGAQAFTSSSKPKSNHCRIRVSSNSSSGKIERGKDNFGGILPALVLNAVSLAPLGPLNLAALETRVNSASTVKSMTSAESICKLDGAKLWAMLLHLKDPSTHAKPYFDKATLTIDLQAARDPNAGKTTVDVPFHFKQLPVPRHSVSFRVRNQSLLPESRGAQVLTVPFIVKVAETDVSDSFELVPTHRRRGKDEHWTRGKYKFNPPKEPPVGFIDLFPGLFSVLDRNGTDMGMDAPVEMEDGDSGLSEPAIESAAESAPPELASAAADPMDVDVEDVAGVVEKGRRNLPPRIDGEEYKAAKNVGDMSVDDYEEQKHNIDLMLTSVIEDVQKLDDGNITDEFRLRAERAIGACRMLMERSPHVKTKSGLNPQTELSQIYSTLTAIVAVKEEEKAILVKFIHAVHLMYVATRVCVSGFAFWVPLLHLAILSNPAITARATIPSTDHTDLIGRDVAFLHSRDFHRLGSADSLDHHVLREYTPSQLRALFRDTFVASSECAFIFLLDTVLSLTKLTPTNGPDWILYHMLDLVLNHEDARFKCVEKEWKRRMENGSVGFVVEEVVGGERMYLSADPKRDSACLKNLRGAIIPSLISLIPDEPTRKTCAEAWGLSNGHAHKMFTFLTEFKTSRDFRSKLAQEKAAAEAANTAKKGKGPAKAAKKGKGTAKAAKAAKAAAKLAGEKPSTEEKKATKDDNARKFLEGNVSNLVYRIFPDDSQVPIGMSDPPKEHECNADGDHFAHGKLYSAEVFAGLLVGQFEKRSSYFEGLPQAEERNQSLRVRVEYGPFSQRVGEGEPQFVGSGHAVVEIGGLTRTEQATADFLMHLNPMDSRGCFKDNATMIGMAATTTSEFAVSASKLLLEAFAYSYRWHSATCGDEVDGLELDENDLLIMAQQHQSFSSTRDGFAYDITKSLNPMSFALTNTAFEPPRYEAPQAPFASAGELEMHDLRRVLGSLGKLGNAENLLFGDDGEVQKRFGLEGISKVLQTPCKNATISVDNWANALGPSKKPVFPQLLAANSAFFHHEKSTILLPRPPGKKLPLQPVQFAAGDDHDANRFMHVRFLETDDTRETLKGDMTSKHLSPVYHVDLREHALVKGEKGRHVTTPLGIKISHSSKQQFHLNIDEAPPISFPLDNSLLGWCMGAPRVHHYEDEDRMTVDVPLMRIIRTEKVRLEIKARIAGREYPKMTWDENEAKKKRDADWEKAMPEIEGVLKGMLESRSVLRSDPRNPSLKAAKQLQSSYVTYVRVKIREIGDAALRRRINRKLDRTLVELKFHGKLYNKADFAEYPDLQKRLGNYQGNHTYISPPKTNPASIPGTFAHDAAHKLPVDCLTMFGDQGLSTFDTAKWSSGHTSKNNPKYLHENLYIADRMEYHRIKSKEAALAEDGVKAAVGAFMAAYGAYVDAAKEEGANAEELARLARATKVAHHARTAAETESRAQQVDDKDPRGRTHYQMERSLHERRAKFVRGTQLQGARLAATANIRGTSDFSTMGKKKSGGKPGLPGALKLVGTLGGGHIRSRQLMMSQMFNKSFNAGMFDFKEDIRGWSLDERFAKVLSLVRGLLVFTECGSTILCFCGRISRIGVSKMFTCSNSRCGDPHCDADASPFKMARDAKSAEFQESLGWTIALLNAVYDAPFMRGKLMAKQRERDARKKHRELAKERRRRARDGIGNDEDDGGGGGGDGDGDGDGDDEEGGGAGGAGGWGGGVFDDEDDDDDEDEGGGMDFMMDVERERRVDRVGVGGVDDVDFSFTVADAAAPSGSGARSERLRSTPGPEASPGAAFSTVVT
ncbi:hypothetical protein HDU98_010165 [Podochytrium sp. JEL0797]|nr:hypothetical protein HDU98_010165 [Podochytrium sp. JEL0797]